jgi:hypothetical protein
MSQCSKPIKPYWKLYASIYFCHLKFGHCFGFRALVFGFSVGKEARSLALLRGIPHTPQLCWWSLIEENRHDKVKYHLEADQSIRGRISCEGLHGPVGD